MKLRFTIIASIMFSLSPTGCQQPRIESDPQNVDTKDVYNGAIRIRGEREISYDDIRPLELIELITANREKVFVADEPETNWFSEDDLAKLVSLVDSDELCAIVWSPISSSQGTEGTTIGETARRMLASFAGTGLFTMIVTGCWSADDARAWWESFHIQAGVKLHNSFVLGGQKKLEGGYLIITSPNQIGFQKEATQLLGMPDMPKRRPVRYNYLIKQFNDRQKVLSLIDRADRPAEYLAVYELLNELFPNYRLDIIEGPFETDVIGYGQIPVKAEAVAPNSETKLSPEEFGKFVKTYWTNIVDQVYRD